MIYLIGMMGCGKTTCGRLLARRLGRELVDTDALIVEREGRSIPDIFEIIVANVVFPVPGGP